MLALLVPGLGMGGGTAAAAPTQPITLPTLGAGR